MSSPDPLHCVACGLCLPHCPTYRKTLNEADSPRGRIALMGAVLNGTLPASPRFFEHIDLCLTCRACERVCPNQVAYGQLVAAVRSRTDGQRHRSVWQKKLRTLLLDGLIAHPARLLALGRVLRFWQASGLQALFRRSGLLRLLGLSKLEAKLPPLPRVRRWQTVYPAVGAERGQVGLFLGCVARLTDSDTLAAAVFLLNRLGYTVHIPSAQTCCGALHASQGAAGTAEYLAQRNQSAFAGLELQAILVTASGCAAGLLENGDGAPWPAPVREVCDFLAGVADWTALPLMPLAQRIAVHDPCTLVNVLGGRDAPYRLLQRIPGAEIVALPGNDQCCGGAGIYSLMQPEMAGMLLSDKQAAVAACAPARIATTNAGCALQLASGLNIPVEHPLVMLARQSGWENSA